MCLAVPGKIVSIKDNLAVVDYGVERREAAVLEDDYSVGDYVIVQGKIVAVKIPAKEAEESLRMYQETVR